MNIDLPTALIAVLITCFYIFIGFGTARAISVMRKEQIRLFCIFFWPIALCVIAWAGEIDFDD